MQSTYPSRRNVLAYGAAAIAAGLLPHVCRGAVEPAPAPATRPAQRYRVAASDWMMLKRQTPGALTRASECGLDGVEVDMGPLGKRPDFDNELRDDAFCTKYVAQA